MLKEQGPQAGFLRTLPGLSHVVICIHFIRGAVKCILYYVAPAVCVCVFGSEKDRALFKPLLSGDIC